MPSHNKAPTHTPRSIYLLAPLYLCLVVILSACQEQAAETNTRPNVIFILADDHRYDFMGFTGKVPELKTPGMDRIAREGAHLQNAFVTTALCSPSRASILSGQLTHH